MNDSPSLPELLEAIARALSDDVLPATTGPSRHTLRIAANLCRIAGRELAATDEAEADLALADLLGSDASDDIARLLDERLQTNDPTFDAKVGDLLFADVCRRVDIAKPGYRGSTDD